MRVMNAIKVKDDRHYQSLLTNPLYMIQEKLKGIRGTINTSTNEKFKFITRGGHDKSYQIPHITKSSYSKVIHDCIFDGELYCEGMEDEILSGYVNRNERSPELIDAKFYIFDILKWGDFILINRTLQQRLTILESIKEYANLGKMEIIPWEGGTIQTKIKFIEALHDKGSEGVMFKNLNSPYSIKETGSNRPANTWYKQKFGTDTYDVIILGFTDAKEGKYYGQIGAVVYGQYKDGKLIEIGQCSGMSDLVRNDMTMYPSAYLGSIMEVEATERNPVSGALIEPRYKCIRRDKTPEECQWI
jgi:ATP-dependent DNA ligase